MQSEGHLSWEIELMFLPSNYIREKSEALTILLDSPWKDNSEDV